MTVAEKTFIGFQQFVARKPSEEALNHSSWRTCAVGEYLGPDFVDDDGDVTRIVDWKNEHLPQEIAYTMLWAGTTPMVGHPRGYLKPRPQLKTYGEVDSYLLAYLKEEAAA